MKTQVDCPFIIFSKPGPRKWQIRKEIASIFAALENGPYPTFDFAGCATEVSIQNIDDMNDFSDVSSKLGALLQTRVKSIADYKHKRNGLKVDDKRYAYVQIAFAFKE